MGGSKSKKKAPPKEDVPSKVLNWFEKSDEGDLPLEEATELIIEMIAKEYGIETPGPGMVKELFDMIDKNGDGKISKEEMELYFEEARKARQENDAQQ